MSYNVHYHVRHNKDKGVNKLVKSALGSLKCFDIVVFIKRSPSRVTRRRKCLSSQVVAVGPSCPR